MPAASISVLISDCMKKSSFSTEPQCAIVQGEAMLKKPKSFMNDAVTRNVTGRIVMVTASSATRQKIGQRQRPSGVGWLRSRPVIEV